LQWDHFRQPLLEWAQGHGMTEVLASSIDNVSILWERGMKTTMLAAIADPSEIGFMETYAPHG
jgi:streptomycin 6-kinase